MATATLLYRVDAGPLLSVSSTLAGGETISLTAASFAGWAASAALWEILDYPPGWPAPVGWSTDSVNGRYYYRASTGPSGVTPPDFTIPVPGPIWGKWLFRLTVNGAIFSAVLGVKTRSPTIDLDDLAYGESSQWGGAKQWPSDQKDNARKIDAAALAAGQVVAGAGLTKTGNTLDVVAADASITVNADSIEASGNFVAKAISTSSSVTAGSAGLVAPKWDRASAGALTLGGTNATSVACSGLGIAKCVSVASDSSLALSSASGDASLDADAAHAAKLGTSTAGGVSIGRSAITVTTTSGGEVHALDDDKEIVTQWGSSSFVVTHSKTYTVAAGGTATPFTFNIPSSSSGSLLLEVEIVDRFNGRRASYVRRYSFSRIAAGASTFTAIGADVEYEDDATWNARATHVSPTITAETVGDAANSTQHFASWTIRYQTFTPTP